MKVLIIAGTSLRYCPYAFFYIDLCQEEDIEFDVAFPDKAGLHEKYQFSTKVYGWKKDRNKYIELVNYRRFVLNLLKEENYSHVILLTTVISVMFYSALKRKNIKYIVDIRDYTHEELIPFYWAETKAIKGSTCCVISSPGFREFLPDYEFIDVFNAPSDLKLRCEYFEKNDGTRPICISYIGTIAYPEQCERLMDLVENDDRFEFALYGNDLNGDRISAYIKNNNLKHSNYHGPYKPEEKGEIIKKADILFNAYGNDSPLLLYALSNKLTDAAMYLKPVLNSPGTSMHKMLGNCSFAIDLKIANNLDELYQWYKQLEPKAVHNNMIKLINTINKTNTKSKTVIVEKIRPESVKLTCQSILA